MLRFIVMLIVLLVPTLITIQWPLRKDQGNNKEKTWTQIDLFNWRIVIDSEKVIGRFLLSWLILQIRTIRSSILNTKINCWNINDTSVATATLAMSMFLQFQSRFPIFPLSSCSTICDLFSLLLVLKFSKLERQYSVRLDGLLLFSKFMLGSYWLVCFYKHFLWYRYRSIFKMTDSCQIRDFFTVTSNDYSFLY